MTPGCPWNICSVKHFGASSLVLIERPRYCPGPGLPKWAGAGLLPAWDQKYPLMCALGTKRRALVHKKIPNHARFGLSPHLKHSVHLEGVLTCTP